jgi:hypothetical protein
MLKEWRQALTTNYNSESVVRIRIGIPKLFFPSLRNGDASSLKEGRGERYCFVAIAIAVVSSVQFAVINVSPLDTFRFLAFCPVSEQPAWVGCLASPR